MSAGTIATAKRGTASSGQVSGVERRFKPDRVWTAFFFVTTVIAVCGREAVAGWAPRVGTIITALLPLASALFLKSAKRSALAQSLAILLGAVHAVFFIAGAIGIWARGNATLFLGGREIPDPVLYGLVSNFSVIGAALVVGVVLGGREAFNLDERPTRSSGSRVAEQRFSRVFANVLFILSLAGLVLTLYNNGGLAATSAIWRTHEFDDAASGFSSIGFTVWVIVSVPAAIMVSRPLWCSTSPGPKIAAGSRLLILMVPMIYVFGSRLNVALAVLGIVFYRLAETGRSVRLWQVLGALIVFTLVSTSVLTSRATLKGTTASTGVADVLGYGILDVATATSFARPELAARETEPERYVTLLESVVPGLGPTGNEIQAVRLDRIIATVVVPGSRGVDSALPPSLPVAFWLSRGAGLGSVLALALGFIIGRLFDFCLRRSSLYAGPLTAMFSIYVVNVYKGGDLPLDFASSVRQVLEVGSVGLLAHLISRRTVNDERRYRGV